MLAARAAAADGPAPSATALDKAIALLDDSRERFRDVRDYDCRLVKRERVNGALLPESVLTMKARTRPFQVYLRCEGPDAEKGLEVCFREGRHHGKMRVRPAGMAGVFGFWTLDPRDPRALAKSRHAVTEAGLGNLLESTARYWEMERALNKTLVQIGEEDIGGRPRLRIETTHPDRAAGKYYGYRCVLWLDKETRLPVGSETYDWPTEDAPEGKLLESYRFLDLRCNIGLGDEVFAH